MTLKVAVQNEAPCRQLPQGPAGPGQGPARAGADVNEGACVPGEEPSADQFSWGPPQDACGYLLCLGP